jgi:tetratricopeptide (TPR) repeat protein
MRLALALLLMATPAFAADDTTREAKEHWQKGAAAYDVGRYEEAVKEFEESYRLAPRSAILFDLARTETKLGHEDKAIDYLERYLKSDPDGPDAASVRSELEARKGAMAARHERARAEADAALAKKSAEEAIRSKDLEREVQATAERRAADARKRKIVRISGFTLGVVGLGLVGGGVGLGISAINDGNAVKTGSGPFSPAKQNEGLAFQNAGIVLDAVGGAVLAAGIALVIYGYRGHAR